MTTPLELAITGAIALVSLYGGMVAAGAQQDREFLRRQRGLAKALLADVQRIADDLRELTAQTLVPWKHGPRAPTIHSWIESLIAQIADEAPEVVTDFMRLQRELALIDKLSASSRSAKEEFNQKLAEFEVMERARREEFDRGIRRPGGHYEPRPSSEWEELPDDDDELEQIAGMDESRFARSAKAKKDLSWYRHVVRHQTERFKDQPAKAMAVVEGLQRRLLPLAHRAVPALPSLVWTSISPVPEDAELRQLDDARILRAHATNFGRDG